MRYRWMYNFRIEKKALLSTESLLGSEEGSDGQQTMSELLNKAFSAKAFSPKANW